MRRAGRRADAGCLQDPARRRRALRRRPSPAPAQGGPACRYAKHAAGGPLRAGSSGLTALSGEGGMPVSQNTFPDSEKTVSFLPSDKYRPMFAPLLLKVTAPETLVDYFEIQLQLQLGAS